MRAPIALLLALALLVSHAISAQPAPRQFTFSWQFDEGDALKPRGGTTRGAAL